MSILAPPPPPYKKNILPGEGGLLCGGLFIGVLFTAFEEVGVEVVMLVDMEGVILDCAMLDPVLGVMLMDPMDIGVLIGVLYVILLLGVLLPLAPVGLESFLTPPATIGVPGALFITVTE